MNLTEFTEKEVQDQVFDEKVLLHPNVKYAWTLCPADKYQGFDVKRPKSVNQVSRWQHVHNLFDKHLRDMQISNIDYLLVTEITEPFGSGGVVQLPRVHFHGYIQFPDYEAILDFLQYIAVDLQPKCKHTIKPVVIEADGTTKWDDYLQKQQVFNIPILTPEFTSLKLKPRKDDTAPEAPRQQPLAVACSEAATPTDRVGQPNEKHTHSRKKVRIKKN